jgi:hypothetical protein
MSSITHSNSRQCWWLLQLLAEKLTTCANDGFAEKQLLEHSG